jgi:hypothetical protein
MFHLTRLALTLGYLAIAFRLSPVIAVVALALALLIGFLTLPQIGNPKKLGALRTALERGHLAVKVSC